MSKLDCVGLCSTSNYPPACVGQCAAKQCMVTRGPDPASHLDIPCVCQQCSSLETVMGTEIDDCVFNALSQSEYSYRCQVSDQCAAKACPPPSKNTMMKPMMKKMVESYGASASSNKTLWIILAIVLGVLIALLVCYLLKKQY